MPRAGFTLIELSIVVVIFALIVGGVFVVKDMLRSAGFRQIASDAERYKAAAYTFRIEYGGLPGDTNRASRFFWCQLCQPGGHPSHWLQR